MSGASVECCTSGQGLAVFDAEFDVGPSGLDEAGDRGRTGGCIWRQLDVTHVFAGALEQATRIAQESAVEQAEVYVCFEDVDGGERRVAETGDRAAVVDEFANFVAAVSDHLKPVLGDRSEGAGAF